MKTLVLENVRCFRHAEIPLEPGVSVFIGENGTGKTTIAEAIASLTHGEGEGLQRFPLRRGAERGAMRILDEAGAVVASWTSDGERRRLPRDSWVFAYGRYRRVLPPPPTSGGPVDLLPGAWADEAFLPPWKADPNEAATSRRTTTLTHSDNKLLHDLGRTLLHVNDVREGDPRMEHVWTRLGVFLRDLGMGFEEVRVIEPDDVSVVVLVRDGVELALSELSDGYQSVLVIVLDLLLRYAHLFADRDDPFAGAALVVVDEIDLHLHPRWQRLVIRQLRSAFPGTTFLLTTHSLAVVQSAIDDDARVFVLDERRGVVALSKRARSALRGADLASVAVEDDLFDVPSRFSPRYEALEDEVARLRERVEQGGTAADRRKLASKLEALHQLFAKDEERRAQDGFLKELAASQIAVMKRLTAALEEAERA